MTSTTTDRRFGVNSGKALKVPCRAATTANITLSGEQTIDGVAVVTGDRVLVKDQTNGVNNGIYDVDTGTWTRSPDFDGAYDIVDGTIVNVTDGTVNEGTWKIVSSDPLTIDTSIILFDRAFEGDAANLTFIAAGTGAVSRTLQSKQRDIVSVFDYLTTAQITDVQARTGLVDTYAAIQAALTAVKTAGGGVLFFPPGTYMTSANLGLTSATGVVVRGSGIDATIIRDSRADVGPYAPTGLFYGLLSFTASTACGIEDLTLYGGWTTTFTFSGQSSTNSRKATYFDASPQCYVRRVKARNFRDEHIYAQNDCPGWHVSDCIVTDCNSNGINLNSGATTSMGAEVVNNYISMCLGDGILVTAGAITVRGNVVSHGNVGQAFSGGGLITVDAAARAIVTDNILYDSDTHGTSVSSLTVFGSAVSTAFLLVANNMLVNIAGDWIDGTGAGILVTNAAGTSVIQGNTIDQCTSAFTGGRGILVSGASTGKVFINGNTIRARAGSLVTNGIKVASTVPANAVLLGVNYFENIVTPYDLGAAVTEDRGGSLVKLLDDFLGEEISAFNWQSLIGTDPECLQAIVVADQARGLIRLTTGDDVAATMAVNGTQLQSQLNWRADQGGLVCEFRVLLSAITNVALFIGLTDQRSALEMPIYSSGVADGITSDATDAVGIMFDTAMATDNWWLVGVANNVDATKQNTALAPTAGTMETWRIELTTAGAARFFRNGAIVGNSMTAAVTATVALTPVVAAFARSTASRNVDCDYILVQAIR